MCRSVPCLRIISDSDKQLGLMETLERDIRNVILKVRRAVTHLTARQPHPRRQTSPFSSLRLHLLPLLRSRIGSKHYRPELDIEYRRVSVVMSEVLQHD